MPVMIEKNTEELTGAALDWAVAKVEDRLDAKGMTYAGFCPSADWSQTGPLIEKNSITLYAPHHMRRKELGWGASRYRVNFPDMIRGETALIAACRKVVQLHLGNTVQIPSELA